MAENAARREGQKIRRSRNGCNECRRLHRRCDENKPYCNACTADGKECSYRRDLAWVAGSSARPQRRHKYSISQSRLQGQSGAANDDDEVHLIPRDRDHLAAWHSSQWPPSPRLPGYNPVTWLPWLSPRHRLLVAHFANVTCATFFLIPAAHHEMCAALLPLVIDSHASFPLVAGILCVAARHLQALEVAGPDDREAAYWEAMAVGHLRRQAIGNGPLNDADAASESIFAATALLLSWHDILTGGERAGSWRVHLEGALAILDRPTPRARDEAAVAACRQLHAMGETMRRVALISHRPPSRTPLAIPPSDRCSSYTHFITCHRVDGELGFSTALLHMLIDIERLAADMTALMQIERRSASGVAGMEPLWAALGRRANAVFADSAALTAELARTPGPQDELLSFAPTSTDAEAGTPSSRAIPPPPPVPPIPTPEQERALFERAFGHITLALIRLQLLGRSSHDAEVQSRLAAAMACLQRIGLHAHPSPGMALVQPAFMIGCYARSADLRAAVSGMLAAAKAKHGRQNASMARAFLVELWGRKDREDVKGRTGKGKDGEEGSEARKTGCERFDVRGPLRVPRRGEEFEWTDLMAEKGWDLSLW